MKTFSIGAAIVILLVSMGVYFMALLQSKNDIPAPEEPVACTLEAKICPDGTAVGRTGPNCEFAACPSPTAQGEVPATPEALRQTFRLALNESARTPSLVLTPTMVVEDSRCASDVACIWAGRVVVRAMLSTAMGTSTMDFAIGTPATTEVDTIVLREVTPYPVSTETIQLPAYRFVFDVTPR